MDTSTNSRQMTTTIWGQLVTFVPPGHPWFHMKNPLWLPLLIPLRGTHLLLNHILSKLYLLHYNVTLMVSFLIHYFDKTDGNEFLKDFNGGNIIFSITMAQLVEMECFIWERNGLLPNCLNNLDHWSFKVFCNDH